MGGEGESGEMAYNVRVHEEFNQEQIPETLAFAGEGAEDTCRTAVENQRQTFGSESGGVEFDLLMVHGVDHESCHERTKDLSKDVVRDLLPGESLPGSEGERHGWVEVTSRARTCHDDGETDTYDGQ